MKEIKKRNKLDKLKFKIEKLYDKYINIFCVKQDVIFKNWEFDTKFKNVLCYSDIFVYKFDISDIKLDIDMNVERNVIIDWYYYYNRFIIPVDLDNENESTKCLTYYEYLKNNNKI